MTKPFRHFLREQESIVVFEISKTSIAQAIKKEVEYVNTRREDEGLEPLEFSDSDLTKEMIDKVVKGYQTAIQDDVLDKGVKFKGLSLPSDVWDAVEDIVQKLDK